MCSTACTNAFPALVKADFAERRAFFACLSAASLMVVTGRLTQFLHQARNRMKKSNEMVQQNQTGNPTRLRNRIIYSNKIIRSKEKNEIHVRN